MSFTQGYFQSSQEFDNSSCSSQASNEPQHCGDTGWCSRNIIFETDKDYPDTTIQFDNDSSGQQVTLSVYKEDEKDTSNPTWLDVSQIACSQGVNPSVFVDIDSGWSYVAVVNSEERVPFYGDLLMDPSG